MVEGISDVFVETKERDQEIDQLNDSICQVVSNGIIKAKRKAGAICFAGGFVAGLVVLLIHFLGFH